MFDYINELIIRKSQLEKEGEEIERQKELYKNNARSENRKLTPLELHELGQRSINYRQQMNAVIHELRAGELLNTLLNIEGSMTFERIILGGGIAATMVYNEMPPEFRNAKQENELPAVIVLNDKTNPHTWPKEGQRLMGQPALIQAPPILSARSESFFLREDNESNPYNYTVAEHFANAIEETQNDMNMPLVNLKAIEIQSKENLTTQTEMEQSWEYDSFKHRIIVSIDTQGTKKYLYTNAIDVCLGLGKPNQLTSTQIDPELSKKLIAENKLLYAQDGDIELKGNVVFYGGSAINAAWIAEIVAGHSSNDARLAYWITPRAESFDNAKRLNRMIASAMTSHKECLALGVLDNIKQLPSGQLELTISSFKSTKHAVAANKETIICDQFIVSIGQQKNNLIKGLNNFSSCLYSSHHAEQNGIPLGTHSQDRSIAIWGAAGSTGIGLSPHEQSGFIRGVSEHARTFPHETQALGGIYRSYWTIKQMAKKLCQAEAFPYSADYKIHDILPDINLATLAEINNFIENLGLYDKTECHKYAEQIIKFRAEEKSIDSFELSGISSIHSLSKLSLPAPILNMLQKTFFPFEPVLKDETEVTKSANKERNSHTNITEFGFFSDRKRTLDAEIFVSDAKYKDILEKKDNEEGFSTTLPLVVK